jgi:hypothetical protein
MNEPTVWTAVRAVGIEADARGSATHRLEMDAASQAGPQARRWLDAHLVEAGIAPGDRTVVRHVGSELAREGSRIAQAERPVILEMVLEGASARLCVSSFATTHRLGARMVEALRSVDEWGFELLPAGERRLWCHIHLTSSLPKPTPRGTHARHP